MKPIPMNSIYCKSSRQLAIRKIGFIVLSGLAVLMAGCNRDKAESGLSNTKFSEIVEAQGIKVVSPSSKELAALKLDYVTFSKQGTTGISITPLAPSFAKPIRLKLSANPNGYDLTSASEKCAAKFQLDVGGDEGAFTLNPAANEKKHLTAATEREVSIIIGDKATPNYFCSLYVTPTAAGDASSATAPDSQAEESGKPK